MAIHDKLFELLANTRLRYPLSEKGEQLVIPVPPSPSKRIQGRAFFPGGSGCSEAASETLQIPPILTLGNNFGSYGYYADCVDDGEEPLENNSTWKQLLDVYQQAGLNPNRCFHSNVYMGFIPGRNNQVEMIITKEFRSDCQQFLVAQLQIVCPRAIIALGSVAKEALTHVSPAIKARWGKVPYSDLYRQDALLIRQAEIPCGKAQWCGDVITIMHPALRRANLEKLRKKSGIDGEAIELKSLKAFARQNG